ncbi:HAD family hydrolase [Nonomuraea sp. SBT364]|uniref:HAD family hydrolase n=1 Tax=Nonomuraea sp. SBT364 TaxID=1580530 RepID=UPI000A915021|nr:HAD family hydrolase [Nonomuraea sp. SBT364]
MNSPRIVATDLDGTLLRSDGTVSPRTREALRLARRAGAEVVFVTARPPRSMAPIARQAGELGTAVCSNGAIVYDVTADEIVTMEAIEPASARKILDALTEALPGIAFAAETGRGVLCQPGYGRTHPGDELYRRGVPDVCAAGEPIVKLLAWSPEHPLDDLFTAAVAAVEGQAEVTHSGVPGLLEISAPGVTKAGTLAGFCERLGAGPADVVAFGDMPNDLAVLAFAGAGYAMANSHHLVLQAVERRTLSNDEDGVAVVLERLFTR